MAGERRTTVELYSDAEIAISKRELSLAALKVHAANRVAEAVIKDGGTTTDKNVFRFAMFGSDQSMRYRLDKLEWKYKEAQNEPVAKFFSHLFQKPGIRQLSAVGMVRKVGEDASPLVYKIEKYDRPAVDESGYPGSGNVPHYNGKVLLPLQAGRHIRDWSAVGGSFKDEEPIDSLQLFSAHRQKTTLEDWVGGDSYDADFVIGWPAICSARGMGYDQHADTLFLTKVSELRREFSASE